MGRKVIRRRIAADLDREFAKLQNRIQKELNWKPPIIQVSKVAAGLINGKRIKLNKVSKKSWDVELI